MWDALLLLVFVTHLPFFFWRWRRSGERRHAATTLTFALLVLAYALRLAAPELRIGGVVLHESFRIVALAAAVVSLGLLAHHGIRRLRRYATRP